MHLVARAGAAFDHPDFTGAGYRPHVTRTRTASVQDGDVFELRQTAIVDMAPHGDWKAAPGGLDSSTGLSHVRAA